MTQKRSLKKIILWAAAGLFILIAGGLVFIYISLNRLLTNSLHHGFDDNIISDVYELKFENLDVNIMTGSVKVFNVEVYPKENPVQHYDYINSSFRLGARKMILKNVNLVKLLRSNKLDLKRIELVEPGIDFIISDSIQVFFPFTQAASAQKERSNKKSIESYFLEEFSMVDAHFNVVNTAKLREFKIQGINISLRDMLIDRQPGRNKISYRHFDFTIGELTGRLEQKAVRYISFKDFNVRIDSLNVEETADTVIYHFADVNSSIQDVDMQTADSIFHVTLKSFNLCYKKNSIEFNDLSFKPNISDAAMQKRFTYRKEHFAGNIGSIKLTGINFDSLIYGRKVLIGEIVLDEVSVSIYKDLRKPFPPNHRPKYLGQQLQAISVPISIQHIKATNVNLVNSEITPDGNNGKANINRATLDVKNVTSLPSTDRLDINADAYIENAAHVQLRISFNYNQPQFSLNGKVDKFDLTKLNALTNSYSPARIKEGIADGITFSGNVYEKYSLGTMTFLYHDLVIDLELEDKAKWKSTVLGFAANTYLNAANPVSENLPVREVEFQVIREMNKGFISMMIKSVLDGVKETFIMSKENKQAYKVAKEEHKKKTKEERKNE